MEFLKKWSLWAFKSLIVLMVLFVGHRFASVLLFKETLVFVCDIQSDTSLPTLPRPKRFTVHFEYMNPYKYPWEQERWHAKSINFPWVVTGTWQGSTLARSYFRGDVLKDDVFYSEGDLYFDRLTGNLDFLGSRKLTLPFNGLTTEQIDFQARCSKIDENTF